VTLTGEALMGDRRALQMGISHDLARTSPGVRHPLPRS
jgi:hypothetical protein